MKLHMSPRVRTWAFRAWIVLFTTVMLWAGLTAMHSAVQANRAVDAVEADAEHDEAVRCVAAWEGRENSRDMAEKTYRRNAETLAGFARDPTLIAAYQEQVEQDVAEIRATLPDPDCDLAAARDRLNR